MIIISFLQKIAKGMKKILLSTLILAFALHAQAQFVNENIPINDQRTTNANYLNSNINDNLSPFGSDVFGSSSILADEPIYREGGGPGGDPDPGDPIPLGGGAYILTILAGAYVAIIGKRKHNKKGN